MLALREDLVGNQLLGVVPHMVLLEKAGAVEAILLPSFIRRGDVCQSAKSLVH